MATSIPRFARVQQTRLGPEPVTLGLQQGVPGRVHFWRGASGQRYVHAVYSLLECPPLPKANYSLIRRDGQGCRTVLHIGSGASDAPTLNLARVRQRGATLGANEVHVHFLAASDEERRLVACDLRAGQFHELRAEPSQAQRA